eukprot:TRINITY_DN52576_c0_g1_i1.p1 TRINITY_DN52576_c0_g1~~TRINITY_DN52576_c0_g1_i1.p1  ORF type:complete len:190 (-),score=33.23 TRINITY_DN52576_c0_g1_i1:48-617(-)
MTGSHQFDVRTLKDTISDKSRWADIEVEAPPADDWGEEGWRQGEDATLAGRRQLGPRGGRRPKFPAEAVMPKAGAEAKPVVVPVPPPIKQEPVKPNASIAAARSSYSDSYAGYWGESWFGQGGSGALDDWEQPSRADLSTSWRRAENEAPVPSNQSAYDGEHWGCRDGGRRNWGRGDHRGGRGKSGQWH